MSGVQSPLLKPDVAVDDPCPLHRGGGGEPNLLVPREDSVKDMG